MGEKRRIHTGQVGLTVLHWTVEAFASVNGPSALQKMLLQLLFVGIVTFHPCSIQGLQVLEDPGTVIAVKDDEILWLPCTGDEAWDYCRWSFRSRSCARAMDASPAVGCDIDPDRIAWAGVPEVDHRCSLRVSDLSALLDSGIWTCQLMKGDEELYLASRNFKVMVYSKAEVAFASRPHQQMEVGREYIVECAGRGGSPRPHLEALVTPVDGTGDEAIGVLKWQFHYYPGLSLQGSR